MENRKYRILFVCTGNICRSPTAEGIMKDLLKKHSLEKQIEVDSAGTHGWHKGEQPDFRSVACARGFGIDISKLKSRPLVDKDFSDFDLIIAMDNKNINDLCRFASKSEVTSQIHKLLEYAPTYGEDVPDPYYKDNFDYVYEMIESACENLLQDIKKNIL
ncbi:MAG: low molecular weight protein-tyrosine-phosphatase [Alphaproteobacteria bacterium]